MLFLDEVPKVDQVPKVQIELSVCVCVCGNKLPTESSYIYVHL